MIPLPLRQGRQQDARQQALLAFTQETAMGDRAQICIKDGKDEVWLYAHWKGAGVYKDLATALNSKAGRCRYSDFEYLARIVFCRLVKGNLYGETGLGIGVKQHDDIEHAIPVVWTDGSYRITWLPSAFGGATPADCSFADFIKRARAGEYDSF